MRSHKLKEIVDTYFDYLEDKGVRKKLFDGDTRFGQKVAAYWSDIRKVTVDLVETNYHNKKFYNINLLELSELSKQYEHGFLGQVGGKIIPPFAGLLSSIFSYDLVGGLTEDPALNALAFSGSFLLGVQAFKLLERGLNPPKIMSPTYYELSSKLNSRFTKQGISKAYKLIEEMRLEKGVKLRYISSLDFARDFTNEYTFFDTQ